MRGAKGANSWGDRCLGDRRVDLVQIDERVRTHREIHAEAREGIKEQIYGVVVARARNE